MNQVIRPGFSAGSLITIVDNATQVANAKLQRIQSEGSSISIGDMFDMQMLMNHLSQLSEMSSAIVSASNSAITTMAKAISR